MTKSPWKDGNAIESQFNTLKSNVVLYRILNRATIGSGQYKLLSGRPVQTGQVLFEFKFTTVQSVRT